MTAMLTSASEIGKAVFCCPEDQPDRSAGGDIDWGWLPPLEDGSVFRPPRVKAADLHSFVKARGNPTLDMPRCELAVLAAMKQWMKGSTTIALATNLHMSKSHVDQAAEALMTRGFVQRDVVSAPWYYTWKDMDVWKPDISKWFGHVNPYLPDLEKPVRSPCPKTLPPQFWHLFWSMYDPSEITFPTYERYVAAQIMLDPENQDLVARAWIMQRFTDETLRFLLKASMYYHDYQRQYIEEVLALRRSTGCDDDNYDPLRPKFV